MDYAFIALISFAAGMVFVEVMNRMQLKRLYDVRKKAIDSQERNNQNWHHQAAKHGFNAEVYADYYNETIENMAIIKATDYILTGVDIHKHKN